MKNKLYSPKNKLLSINIVLNNDNVKLKFNKKIIKLLYSHCVNDSKKIQNLPFLYNMLDFLVNRKDFSILKLKDRYFLESLIINNIEIFYFLINVLNRKKKIFYVKTEKRKSAI